jgi:hypothetical protein
MSKRVKKKLYFNDLNPAFAKALKFNCNNKLKAKNQLYFTESARSFQGKSCH